MFSGSHLVSFEVTMPRLWTIDYYPNNRGRVIIKDDVLDVLVKDKLYVIIYFPFNITLQENQSEILLDALIKRGFVIDHVVSSKYGTSAKEYILKRVISTV